MASEYVTKLAKELSQLNTDALWELANELTSNHKIVANILMADLDQSRYVKSDLT